VICDVRYRIRLNSGARACESVAGMRVGRFALRRCRVGETVGRPGRPARVLRAFGVDHIASGMGIADFSEFVDALALADDLSRFSRRDPSSRDPWRTIELIGPALMPWLRACLGADHVTPYRQWLSNQQQVETATP
jgi:hypothetical protein